LIFTGGQLRKRYRFYLEGILRDVSKGNNLYEYSGLGIGSRRSMALKKMPNEF
jgi:hypothetical protein